MSLTILGVWAAIWLMSGLSPNDDEAGPPSWQFLTRSGCQIGAVYGFGSAFCWLATAVKHPVSRMVIRIAVVAIFSLLLSRFGTPDWARQAINLAGLVIAQSVWFGWWKVPGWTIAARPGNATRSTRRQFQIADLLAITTGLACLLGLAIRYSSPVDAGIYWAVLVAVWLLAPGIPTCLALAALIQSPSPAPFQTIGASRVLVCAGMGATTVLGVGLAIAEGYTMKYSATSIQMSFVYGVLFLVYGGTHFVFGLAGSAQTLLSQTSAMAEDESES